MQHPAADRIVHVFMDPRHNNGSDVAPAIITRVWNDTCVNLRILGDSNEIPPWRTSQMLYAGPDEARKAHDEAWAHIPAEQRPEHPVGAFWPPHVGEQPGEPTRGPLDEPEASLD